jgi:hypothetical protein
VNQTAGLSRRHAVNVTARGFVFVSLLAAGVAAAAVGLGCGVVRGTLELAAAVSGVGECGRDVRAPAPAGGFRANGMEWNGKRYRGEVRRGFVNAGVGSEPTCH